MCCNNKPELVNARLSDVKKFGFDRYHGYKVLNVYNPRDKKNSYTRSCKSLGIDKDSDLAPKAVVLTPFVYNRINLGKNIIEAKRLGPFNDFPVKEATRVFNGVHVYNNLKTAKKKFPRLDRDSKVQARLFVPVVGLMNDYVAEDKDTLVFKKVFIEDHIWTELLEAFMPGWEAPK